MIGRATKGVTRRCKDAVSCAHHLYMLQTQGMHYLREDSASELRQYRSSKKATMRTGLVSTILKSCLSVSIEHQHRMAAPRARTVHEGNVKVPTSSLHSITNHTELEASRPRPCTNGHENVNSNPMRYISDSSIDASPTYQRAQYDSVYFLVNVLSRWRIDSFRQLSQLSSALTLTLPAATRSMNSNRSMISVFSAWCFLV